MSQPDGARTSSPGLTSSEKAVIEVHVLACGHGDTILLHLPGDKWVLVDCYLSKYDGTRDRFFEFVESRGIRTLDFVFLTHPDYDHFHGMADVLEHFTRDGRSVGTYCDAGVDAQQVRSLLKGRTGETEFERLQRRLDDLDERGAINFYAINDQHATVSPKGYKGSVDLIPIGPEASRARRLTRRGVAKLQSDRKAELPANELSIVLVLWAKEGARDICLLLAGDADAEGLEGAMEIWRSRAAEREVDEGFDAVKVPHHGSFDSHWAELPKTGRKDAAKVAVISAGQRPALPDRRVIRDFMDRGWRVLITTRRGGARIRDLPMTLANRGGGVVVGGRATWHDIRLTWDSARGLTWEPKEAEIQKSDLQAYETGSGG